MYEANCYNVMIVSPSDVSTEREIAKNVLYRWNELNSRFRNIVFSVLGYDTNAHTDSGNHPQELLNHQLLEQADIIIAVFWTKLGTPTKEYSSGSVEEISQHIKQGKKVHIYFSNKVAELEKVDMEQYRKLQNYKTSIQGNAFYKEFSTEEDFEHKLSDDIQLIANELSLKKIVIPNPTSENKANLSEMEIEVLKIMKGQRLLQFAKIWGQMSFNGDLITDQRRATNIEEAMDSLENKGLIKPFNSSRNAFDLTAAGYRVCDQIE